MNPNIALGIQRPRFNAPGDQLNALAIRNQQMQSAVAQQQMAAQQQALQRDERVRNALAGTGGDYNAVRDVYMQEGDVAGAMNVDKYLSGLDETKRKQALGEVDTLVKVAPLLMNPETYGQGYSILQQSAPGAASRLPAQFTPEAVPAIESMALGAKGMLDKQQGEKRLEIDRQRLERTPTVADRKEIAALGANRTTFNNTQETAERREMGKSLVREFDTVRERADNSMAEIQSLDQLRGINVQTGRLEDLKAGIASYAQALGVDPTQIGLPDPTNAQAFNATAQQLVLRVMQAQKGPQTENDAKRIEMTVASLKNTEDAKNFLIDAAKEVRRRDVEQADFYDSWRERNGTLDGARKGWREYIGRTPLMGNNPVSGLPVFFGQYRDAMRQANPEATDDQIMMLWRKKYGR